MRCCAGCAQWDPIAQLDRGLRTGVCSLAFNGKVTRADHSCPFYVRNYGTGFDINVATDSFLASREGKSGSAPTDGRYRYHKTVDTDAIRSREARDRKWRRG